MNRVTIRDVAQLAGYSITTVSMVLNNKDVCIPSNTQKKVWDAARELGYRPNKLAVSMVTKRSHVLGLIIPDNSNLFFAELSKAIECAARRAGYGLIYGNSSNDLKHDIQYIQMFADQQVDGIVFTKSTSLAREDDEKLLDCMADCALPFVMVDRQIPGSDTCAVLLNHFKGGYLATRHLISLGHTRIGAYTGPRDLQSSNERLMGYRSALEEAGIPYDENLVFEGNYQYTGGEAALRHFLNQGVSAVFCFNDLMAFGLYRELPAAGLRVPQDLSIVGFDNIFLNDIVQPALTTVEQPIAAMGQSAVNFLIRLIEGEDIPPYSRRDIFEPKLIVRSSTAEYRKG